MLLLTPGPLTTAASTRAALTDDWGSRDPRFVALVARVLGGIRALVGDDGTWSCVPMQGSGTFAVEAMLTSLTPRDAKILVVDNGAYGARMAAMCRYSARAHTVLRFAQDTPADPAAVDAALAADPAATHVAMVYSETTSGLVNPLDAVADVVAARGRRLLVDAMSAFGALPLGSARFDAIAASANKCLEGVPGLAFVVARRDVLAASEGNAGSLALDLYDQWRRLEADGQFRFTPPTHVLAALDEALRLHAAEGGTAGRGERYGRNRDLLLAGMQRLGFRLFLAPEHQGPIIATFHQPRHEAFDFAAFYDALCERGFAIYPGKLTDAPTFRVGVIGQVHPADVERFVDAVAAVLTEQGVS